MFIPFRINIDEIYKLDTPSPLHLINIEKEIQSAKDFLCSKIDLETGILDAEEIKKGWLPTDKNYHIFISYSHDDKSKAEKLANWFESRGIKCFLDAYYWKNADDLLKTIDDIKCKNPSGETYNYRKRNYSTSLIHAILTMAIMEAIEKCDFGIFIESKNSVSINLDNIKTFTLSPWIYEELNIMTSIEKRIPSWMNCRQIKLFSKGSKMIVESSAPINMKFSVPLDQLLELESEDLTNTQGNGIEWLNNFIRRCDSELNVI